MKQVFGPLLNIDICWNPHTIAFRNVLFAIPRRTSAAARSGVYLVTILTVTFPRESALHTSDLSHSRMIRY